MSELRAPVFHHRIPVHGLDIVRFTAASLVVLYHLGFKAWALDSSSLHLALGDSVLIPFGYALTWCGWVGVQVFFVVSGSVIAYSAHGASARGFARRRVARLLPAVLIAVAVALPIAVFVLGTRPGQAIVLTLKTVAFVPWGPWIIGQFWTIPIELAFYALVWGILASGAPERAMHAITWILGLASAAYWLIVDLGLIQPGGRISELSLLQHGIYFALGMLCARLGESNLKLPHCGLALACFVAASAQVRTAAVWEMETRIDLSAHWPWAYALWLGLTISVGGAFLWRAPIAARIGRFSRLLRLTGLMTYPLYLIHIHIGGAILIAAASLGHAPAVMLAFASSVVVAGAIARWFEPPFHVAIDMALRRIGQHVPRHWRMG
ncbi:MAG: acyltransferase [Novosphingobium sp.]